jgi:outer membrane protein assembly factor BamA
MKRMHQGFIYLLLLFFATHVACLESVSLALVDYERQSTKLDSFLPEPLFIKQIILQDPLETTCLKNIIPIIPAPIGADNLKTVVFYIAATQRYETVVFTLSQDQLSIELKPHRIFERCKVSGQTIGSELIKHEYLLKPGTVFNERFAQQAVAELENSYKKKGFLDARVQDQCIENEPRKTVQVHLKLNQGTAYPADALHEQVRHPHFIFTGNEAFASGQLEQVLCLYGTALEHIPHHLLAQTVQDWYCKQGYTNAQVSVQKQVNQLLVTIVEGAQNTKVPPRARPQRASACMPHIFGQTVLQKTSTLPDEYILRELTYGTGQLFTTQEVATTLGRLSKRQIFDRIHLYPVQTPFAPNEYTMVLQVRDDEPRELRTRAGISLQQMSKEFSFKNVSYAAGGTFLVKNPTNHADLFFVDADYTYGEQILSLNYHYPWIGSLPIHGKFQLYAMQYLQPGLRHNHKNIYSFVQQGALMGLHYEKDNWDAQVNYGLEWMETKLKNCQDYPLFCKELSRALNFAPALLDKKIPYFFTEPTVVLDRLDDPLNPTQGSLAMMSGKAMIPCKHLGFNSSFAKILFDHAYFVPFQYAVLGVRMRIGHIFFNTFENIMPAERFYLGGANSIRSYDTDLCPPLGVLTTDEDKLRYVPQGAQSMANLNIELRIPAKRNLWVAVFQDMGALSNTKFADIKMRHILAGTGAGIRIQTPIGPLRFDFAFKWHRPDQTIAPYCWFLSFGNAF